MTAGKTRSWLQGIVRIPQQPTMRGPLCEPARLHTMRPWTLLDVLSVITCATIGSFAGNKKLPESRQEGRDSAPIDMGQGNG
jgi:hypothetical protein